MAKGIIYIMNTVVDGLIKIGKTQTKQFDKRMQYLENNGYRNITGLKRKFAIEVSNYDEKEALLHNIFDRSRVPNTELFALNVDLAVQLLSAFEGDQVFPKPNQQSKKEVFEEATERVSSSKIPNGIYYLRRRIKAFNNTIIKAQMEIKDGKYIVLAGSTICPIEDSNITKQIHNRRLTANIENNILKENEEFSSASTAAVFVIGKSDNGRIRWKTTEGIPLAVFMQEPKQEDE
ncbi:MAG: DUF4357 domain-containing protein [Lachnospiraceae bacterium]|nr:DUF4357 domain-containing protein [Lachnospiraceae bacterium]